MSLQLREDLYKAKEGKMTLNNEEINRYSRHLTLPEVGMGGQLKLKEAKEFREKRSIFLGTYSLKAKWIIIFTI